MFEMLSTVIAISTMTICLTVIITNIMYPMGKKK